jgi:hypothetical protein
VEENKMGFFCRVIEKSIAKNVSKGSYTYHTQFHPVFHLFFPRKRKEKSFKIPFVINKTRFYTHARIEHTHEIVLSARSTTGIVFGTSSSDFSSRLFFVFSAQTRCFFT